MSTYSIEMTRDQEADVVLAEIAAAIAKLPDPGDEARPNVRAELRARRIRLEALQADLHTTGQLTRQITIRIERFETERRVTLRALADLRRDLAAAPRRTGGYDEMRDREAIVELEAALAWLREGQGRDVPGPVLRWQRTHGVEHLYRLPDVDRVIADAKAARAPMQARIDAAIVAWRGEHSAT
jgi:hypothetical protein